MLCFEGRTKKQIALLEKQIISKKLKGENRLEDTPIKDQLNYLPF